MHLLIFLGWAIFSTCCFRKQKMKQLLVPSRGGAMPSRSNQQVGMSGSIRGNTVIHSHSTNPHCCGCNNALTSSGVNHSNPSYSTGQVNMYHGNVQNHNNHVHIQQGQEVYHNDRIGHENAHIQQQRHHHNNPQQYGSRAEFQRMSKASLQDATQYYICECTTCRNLGNSVDICCQCCNCGNMTAAIIQEDGEDGEIYSEYPSSRGYTVSSVALTGDTEDTLEVVFDDGDGANEVIDERQQQRKYSKNCNNVEGHHHIHGEEDKEIADDITYAHHIAESVHNHQGRQIHKQHSNCNSCACSGKPLFQGWSSHHINSNAPHPQHQQNSHRHGMHSTKANMNFHHQTRNSSQGRITSTNHQNCNVTSPQQQNAQMNSRSIHNHHGHPNYTNSHSPNSTCINNQHARINHNGTHHSKQYNNRVHKAHTCCSQGKKDEPQTS